MSDLARIWTRARRRGDLPVSLVLVRAVGTIALFVALPALGARAWRDGMRAVEVTLSRVAHHAETGETLRAITEVSPWPLIGAVLSGVLPFAALLGALALGSGIVQTRGWFGLPQTSARPRRLRASAAPALAALVLLLVTTAGWFVAHPEVWTSTSSSGGLGRPLTGALVNLAWPFTGIILAAAALDVAVVRWRWRRRNELDPSGERRERRQRELAPEVRAALRQLHRDALGNSD